MAGKDRKNWILEFLDLKIYYHKSANDPLLVHILLLYVGKISIYVSSNYQKCFVLSLSYLSFKKTTEFYKIVQFPLRFFLFARTQSLIWVFDNRSGFHVAKKSFSHMYILTTVLLMIWLKSCIFFAWQQTPVYL